MELIITIVVAGLMGYWCYRIAQRNGRDTTLAGFMGFLFGLFAVVIYYLIGKTKKIKVKEIEDIIHNLK